MRTVDTNNLSSLYESAIVKKQVVSEAMPPFAELEGLSPSKYKEFAAGEEDQKVLRHPSYGEAPYRQKRLTEDEARNAIWAIGKEIIAICKAYPNGVFPGTRDELKAELIKPDGAIAKTLKDATGKPIYAKSWWPFIAGQVIKALKDAKVIEEFSDRIRKPTGGRNLDAIIPNIPAPAELFNPPKATKSKKI